MKFTSNKHGKALVVLLGLAALGGCANQNIQTTLSSSAEFNACSESVWSAAEQANTSAKYYSVAQQAQLCLQNAPVTAPRLKSDESAMALRLHALAITNFIKAGELAQARVAYSDFEAAYPHSDLQLADGSSFADSMQLLFDAASKTQASSNSLLNASASLKAELRRQHYWNLN